MSAGKPPHLALSFLLAMVVSLGALGGMTQPASAATVSVTIDPPTTSVTPGQSFDLAIKLASDTQTRGVQFGMTFDPSLLEVSKLTTGPYYSDWAKANQATANEAIPFRPDNANGRVTPGVIAIFGGTAKAGPSGPGTLLTVTFNAKAGADGSTPVTIDNFVISDTNAQTIHGAKVINGTVAVGQAAAAATSPTVAAAASPSAAVAQAPSPAAQSTVKPAPAASATPAPAAAPPVTATPAPAQSPTSASAATAATLSPTPAGPVGPGIPTVIPVVAPAGSPGIIIPWEAVGGFGGGIIAAAAVLYALRRSEP
jgi:hypothetical protein